MLNAIQTRSAIAECQSALRVQIHEALTHRVLAHVGYQGGGGRQDVYHDGYFWYTYRKESAASIPRYWNAFGLGYGTKINRGIVVEINPPISGVSKQVSGLFASNRRGDLFLLHTGRLAGGRPGIGKRAFTEFTHLPWVDVDCGERGILKAIVVGSVRTKGFVSTLREFVEEVARFKELSQDRDLTQVEEDQLKLIEDDKHIGVVQREQLILARVGQGRFRKGVQRIENKCRVTGISAAEHLRASHIKPWARCSNVEKLDGHNGLLLAPHVDHLFDRGFVSFADNGGLLISNRMDRRVLRLWGLAKLPAPGKFTVRQRAYLTYHRKQIFQKLDGRVDQMVASDQA